VTTSTHMAEVVPVILEPHPNADTLSVVRIWGYTCVVKTDQWAGTHRAAYVVPDTLVDTRRPEFAFLAPDARADGLYRVRVKRLRGVISQGLLVPTDAPVGSDLYADLGLSRYEPGTGGNPRSATDRFVIGGETSPEPAVLTGPAKYDVEAFERYHDSFVSGESVFIQEKLDGSNCRVLFWDGEFHVKSRNRWLRRVPAYSHVTEEQLRANGCPEDKIAGVLEMVRKKDGAVNGFWSVLEATPGLFDYLRANPGTTVYGEVYGTTNRIKYGPNRFAAFDVFRREQFVPFGDAMAELSGAGVPVAPYWCDTYSFDRVLTAREGKTLVSPVTGPTPIREGVVVRPYAERTVPHLGRLVLKAVNPDFHSLGG